MPRCFFYGSYMDVEILRAYGAPSAAQAVPARLPDWQLGFTPHANLRRAPGETTCGLVIELPEAEVRRLYGADGFVTDYEPVAVTVNCLGGPLAATTFVAPWVPAAPDADYLATFADICRKVGVPVPVVAAANAPSVT